MEREPRARFDLELEEVQVFGLFDGTADGGRQGDLLGLGGRVVFGRLADYGIAGDDDLPHGAGAVRGDDAKVADSGNGIGSDCESDLDFGSISLTAAATLSRFWLF